MTSQKQINSHSHDPLFILIKDYFRSQFTYGAWDSFYGRHLILARLIHGELLISSVKVEK